MSSLFEARGSEEDGQFTKQLQQHRERYYSYELEKNPFPLGGNYPEAYLPYTHIDHVKEDRIRDFLASTFVREEFNGLLVIGEYGSGKSHILHYVRQIVLTDPFFGKQALCFLIQNPSVSPADILLSMLREVKLGVVQDLIFTPVAKALKEKYQSKTLQFLTDFTNFKRQGMLDDVKYNPNWYQNLFNLSYREFVKILNDEKVSLNKKSLQNFAREALQQHVQIGSSAIINDLVQLIADDDDSRNALSWETFLSSSLMSSKKGSLGIEHYLQAFLELFKSAGFRHIYLLVDELEDLRTQRLSTKATTEYLATLRRMIQHNYKMFSFVLACTRDAWSDLLNLYPAIADRFPIVVDLAPNKSEIRNIVLRYLKETRREGNVPENEWTPFTEDAVEEVISRRGLVLRHILTELRAILDVAASKNISLPIDVSFVRENLSPTT